VVLLAVVLMMIVGADAPGRPEQGALMARRQAPRGSASGRWRGLFGLFVLFLYGPMITIFVLSFQGPEGGLTFPMRGVSLHWFAKLWEGIGVVDIGAALPPLAGAGRGGDGADGAAVAAARGWPTASGCRRRRRCSTWWWPA
jgi:hypothetical protein